MHIPGLWLRPLQSCSDDSNAFGNLGGGSSSNKSSRHLHLLTRCQVPL